MREYRQGQKMREYRRQYKRNRIQKNKRCRIDHIMSKNICTSLQGKKAGRRWETLVGYTVDDLMKHLEKYFHKGMSWENYGFYWHIDHFVPKSYFVYEDDDSVEFINCWALNNLRPMLAVDNWKKGDDIFANFYISKSDA